MIGWYVHSHGLGHLHRLQSINAHLRTPVTVLSSLPRPAGWQQEWVQLAQDLPRGEHTDPTAGGTLHWAPRHHPGLLERAAQLTAWVARARPSLVVVDVSVEVAVLVRTLGVPVIVVAMRGDRTDRPHRTAYDLAEALLAPWPAALAEPWPDSWLRKTWHVGAMSRLDGRPATPAPGRRQVLLLWGTGGSEVTVRDVQAAVAGTPDWSWELLGLGGGWAGDPWGQLQKADVVVTHAGQNALAEVAAARRPAVVVPQVRPYGEQTATARALQAGGLALVFPSWPSPDRWPGLLEQTAARDGAAWATWSDGRAAERAAALLQGAHDRLAA